MASFKDNPGPVFCPETLKIEISDERDSELDRLIKDSWQCRMTNGHFRYDISDVRTRIVEKFVCQLNPKRATSRRKPESMETVRQPFDTAKFNFTKAALDKELVCVVNSPDLDDATNAKTTAQNVIIINVSPIELGHCLLERIPQNLFPVTKCS